VIVLTLGAVGAGVTGCADAPPEREALDQAATIREVKHTNRVAVTLSKVGLDRLGLKTAPVTGQAGALVVPYGAVLYDGNGKTWVYVRTAPRTFVRSPITVTDITGNDVTASRGPDVGTPVVTRGVAELYGAEAEIGAEEPE
jgi:hypothetical protein